MDGEEIGSIILALLVMTFVVGFSELTVEAFLYAFIISFTLVFVFIVSQKVVADYLGLDIKFKLWTFKRYWLRWQDEFDWEFPMWITLPLILAVASNGFLRWTALLVFVTRITPKKVATKFSEIREFDLALVAASGIFSALAIALIMKMVGLNEFASIASWFAVLNTIPLGNLNGTKLFFGSKVLWIFLVVLTIIILILIELTQIFATIFIALILAAIAAIIFYYFYYAKGK